MASILEIDPDQAGLAQAAGIIGQLSGPSRMPVGLGSILGQAGGAAVQGRNQATMQAAQLQQLQDAQGAKQAALAEQQRKAQAGQAFNSILGKMQESGESLDEISILNAGIKSGAFGPAETTNFMSKVMEKRADRETKIELAREKAADKRLSEEEKKAATIEMEKLRASNREDLARLAATLRPPAAQEPLVTVDDGDGRARYVPRSEAIGKFAPPRSTGDRLTETEAKGTLFFRQMRSAEEEVGKIVGPVFDPNKVGNQIGMRMARSDWTNFMAPQKAQQYAQAAEQWAEAYLRLKTGAATNQDEIKRNARAYFPQPGDKPDVIRQKNDMRKKAVEDVSIVAGRGVNREPEFKSSEQKDPWE